ncbi:MAG: zinc-ribbon domain-containing protein [Candidatus Bathyarchaeia archaeon]|nr:zinc-ribbon domain-containing protein [Candidatus Bathyarchaeota archaeon]
MVYCVRCGAKNEDDAKFCSICGAPLYLPHRGEVGSRDVNPRERIEGECFGIPRGSSVVGLAIGLIIVLAGLSLLLKELYQITIPWWPIAVIILGVFIIIGAILGSRRR